MHPRLRTRRPKPEIIIGGTRDVCPECAKQAFDGFVLLPVLYQGELCYGAVTTILENGESRTSMECVRVLLAFVKRNDGSRMPESVKAQEG